MLRAKFEETRRFGNYVVVLKITVTILGNFKSVHTYTIDHIKQVTSTSNMEFKIAERDKIETFSS